MGIGASLTQRTSYVPSMNTCMCPVLMAFGCPTGSPSTKSFSVNDNANVGGTLEFVFSDPAGPSIEIPGVPNGIGAVVIDTVMFCVIFGLKLA